MRLFKALTIAGSDSGGGAGIQADLKTFMAHGVYGTSAITAITAQNTLGIQAMALIEPSLVAAQIDSVLSDIGADAVKTGMLGEKGIIEAVAEQIQKHRVRQLVIDPVMVSTSGTPLLTQDSLAALRDVLLPLALVVTPNLAEASVFVGYTVTSEADMQRAARDIHQMVQSNRRGDAEPHYVLLKGGHLAGDPVDILYDGRHSQSLRAPRIHTPHTHGTGCTYSAAITARLAQGHPVEQAVQEAKAYLHAALQGATAIGAGRSPLHHAVMDTENGDIIVQEGGTIG